MNRLSRMDGVTADRPTPIRASSAASPPSRRLVVTGCRTSRAAKRTVEEFGDSRRIGPSAASTSKASSGVARSASSSSSGSVISGLLRRDDLALHDFAGGVLRKRVHDPYLAWVLVRGDLALDVRAQFVGRRAGAWLERDRRADLLAELGVGESDDRDLGHRRVLVHHLLDLPRVHVVPTSDDEVLLPPDDEEVPLLVDPADVTGVEPAVPDHC